MKPELIIGTITIPTYFLIISLCACLAPPWILYLNQRLKSGLNSEQALSLGARLLLIGVFGGRLLHVIYEAPSYYIELPFRIFEFWKGGFVVFGAVISGFIYLLLTKPSGQVLTLVALTYSPLYAFGRLGCWFQGCCALSLLENYFQMNQLWYLFFELCLWITLWMNRHRFPIFKFELANTWLSIHMLTRFILEFFRLDDRGPVWIFSISQWIAIIFFLLAMPPIWKKVFNREPQVTPEVTF